MNILLWYCIGAAVWAFLTGIAYMFAGLPGDKRWCARAFFFFPIWPTALLAVLIQGLMRLWKSAEWKATHGNH